MACRLWVIYVREDNDSNVQAMITRLIWTSLSAVPRKAVKFTHSLTHSSFVPHLQSYVNRDNMHWPILLTQCSGNIIARLLANGWTIFTCKLHCYWLKGLWVMTASIHNTIRNTNSLKAIRAASSLTHCGLVTPYGDRSGSSLAQVMACCLTAPSHYLNQWWLIINEVQWHSY